MLERGPTPAHRARTPLARNMAPAAVPAKENAPTVASPLPALPAFKCSNSDGRRACARPSTSSSLSLPVPCRVASASDPAATSAGAGAAVVVVGGGGGGDG